MPEATLKPGEEALEHSAELIWRNVHPAWIDDGALTSQVFRPTPKDHKKLSGARQRMVTASEHFKEFTKDLELESAGVWAISAGEALDSGVRGVYDAESATPPDPCPTGHTFIDYREVSGSRARKIGSALRDLAEARGPQHTAD